MGTSRRRYPTDLSELQWDLIEPLVPHLKPGGRNLKYERREVVNAILYIARAGCAWRLMPHDLPDWQTAYHYFNEWSKDGTWQRIHETLRRKLRAKVGRNERPTAAIIDSQSVKTTERGGPHGYDGAKKISGRKRHAVVDTLGLVVALHVTPADVQDRSEAKPIIEQAKTEAPDLSLVWADQAYRSEELRKDIKASTGIELSITGERRPSAIWWPADKPLPESFADRFKEGFRLVKRRWVIERTFAWFGRYRRLVKDYEYSTRNSESMIYAAMANNMSRRIVRA